jgi:hypothetical protein
LIWWNQIHHRPKQKVKDNNDVVAGTLAYHKLLDSNKERLLLASPQFGDNNNMGFPFKMIHFEDYKQATMKASGYIQLHNLIKHISELL